MTPLEAALADTENRVVERNDAIKRNDAQAEQRTDQNIVQGLWNADACPPNAPDAKQGFQNSANKYERSRSRHERDNIIVAITKGVLIKQGVAAILVGASALTIASLAAPDAMCSMDGTEFSGHSIDNGDGTHQFLYDSNSNGIVDAQVTVSDQTGTTISQEPDSLGVEDMLEHAFDLVLRLF